MSIRTIIAMSTAGVPFFSGNYICNAGLKKAAPIKEKISEIHAICQTIADRISRKDLITNAAIKDAFLLYFRDFPIINKEFKKLEQILI
ncbi:MAG: hypothetical protein ACTSVL_08490 [Promethearchaeota archaeon]